MIRLSYYTRRIEEEMCKHLHIVRFYFTAEGLKNVGASQFLGALPVGTNTCIDLPANQLFLGPDYLKDTYTLLHTPILQSPHMDFVRAQRDALPIMDTEYIHRYLKGKLDWRHEMILPKDPSYFEHQFAASLTAIQGGTYPPVLVYKQGEHYYIFDGKHRAALCALLNRPVKCNIVGSDIANAHLWHYMFSLIIDNPAYKKHREFHEQFMKENNIYSHAK